jgi:hypothetical protein
VPAIFELNDAMVQHTVVDGRLENSDSDGSLFLIFVENNGKCAECEKVRPASAPWCLTYTQALIELRQLSKMPASLSIASFSCSSHPQVCKNMRVKNFPAARLYKSTGYQTYHGVYRVNEVSAWLKVCGFGAESFG